MPELGPPTPYKKIRNKLCFGNAKGVRGKRKTSITLPMRASARVIAKRKKQDPCRTASPPPTLGSAPHGSEAPPPSEIHTPRVTAVGESVAPSSCSIQKTVSLGASSHALDPSRNQTPSPLKKIATAITYVTSSSTSEQEPDSEGNSVVPIFIRRSLIDRSFATRTDIFCSLQAGTPADITKGDATGDRATRDASPPKEGSTLVRDPPQQ